jgi:hypothetical protein
MTDNGTQRHPASRPHQRRTSMQDHDKDEIDKQDLPSEPAPPAPEPVTPPAEPVTLPPEPLVPPSEPVVPPSEPLMHAEAPAWQRST